MLSGDRSIAYLSSRRIPRKGLAVSVSVPSPKLGEDTNRGENLPSSCTITIPVLNLNTSIHLQTASYHLRIRSRTIMDAPLRQFPPGFHTHTIHRVSPNCSPPAWVSLGVPPSPLGFAYEYDQQAHAHAVMNMGNMNMGNWAFEQAMMVPTPTVMGMFPNLPFSGPSMPGRRLLARFSKPDSPTHGLLSLSSASAGQPVAATPPSDQIAVSCAPFVFSCSATSFPFFSRSSAAHYASYK
ncbi:hypothetical protein C8J57DRAFT_586255 [Mycena rebaudengoi]|nr:hypothetical protein C8J57DRAFT_586255 [Mycena rebaudengoi]